MSNLLDLIDQVRVEFDFQYSPPKGGVFIVNRVIIHSHTREQVGVIIRKRMHWKHCRLWCSQYTNLLLNHTSENVRNILASVFSDKKLRQYFAEHTEAIYDVLTYFRSKKNLSFMDELHENWIYVFIHYLRLYLFLNYRLWKK